MDALWLSTDLWPRTLLSVLLAVKGLRRLGGGYLAGCLQRRVRVVLHLTVRVRRRRRKGMTGWWVVLRVPEVG